MKKFIILFIIAVLMLTACGNKDEDSVDLVASQI